MNVERICCIIDLDGFSAGRTFLVRELGWIDIASNCSGSIRFNLTNYKTMMTVKDQHSNDYRTKKIHGLTFEPMPGEPTHPLNYLDGEIQRIYSLCHTDVRDIVAYKGGSNEKNLLVKLNIPFLNLEQFGCPRYDELKHIYSRTVSCGYHIRNLHCPLAEVTAFKLWLCNHFEHLMT